MNSVNFFKGFGVLFLFSGALEYANALTAMTDWTQGHGASLEVAQSEDAMLFKLTVKSLYASLPVEVN